MVSPLANQKKCQKGFILIKFVFKKGMANRRSVIPFFAYLLGYFSKNTKYSVILIIKSIRGERAFLDVIRHAWLSYKLSNAANDRNKDERGQSVRSILSLSQLDTEWLKPAWQSDATKKVTKLGYILPVYADTKVTVACLNCVLGSKTNLEIKVLIVNDCSPEPDMASALSEIAENDHRVKILTNSTNLGFVQSVNLAASHDFLSGINFVILNSDCFVGDWIADTFVTIYQSYEDIGTITATTNNGTICSFPKLLGQSKNAFDLAHTEIAEYLANTGIGVVEIPVGVGHCIFVNRYCWERNAGFDISFGKGYGEEVDFCLKLRAQGYKNVQALEIYVEHIGEVSFSSSRENEVETATKVINERFPYFEPDVSYYLNSAPFVYAKLLVLSEICKAAKIPVVLNFLHELGGGVSTSILNTIKAFDSDAVFINVTPFKGENYFRSEIFICEKGKAVSEEPTDKMVLDFHLDHAFMTKIIKLLKPRILHLHHFYSAAFNDLSCLVPHCEKVFFTIHDYSSFCRRTFFVRNAKSMDVCQTVEAKKCEACSPSDNISLIMALTQNTWLKQSDLILCPSKSVESNLKSFGVDTPTKVVYHDDFEQKFYNLKTRNSAKRVTIGIVGHMSDHKGGFQLSEVARKLSNTDDAGITFKFVVLGSLHGEYNLPSNVVATGDYKEQDFIDLVKTHLIDAFFFPSIAQETFSFSLSRAFQTGLPLIVPNVGVYAERTKGMRNVFYFDWWKGDISDAINVIRTQSYLKADDPSVSTKQKSPVLSKFLSKELYESKSQNTDMRSRHFIWVVHSGEVWDACEQIRLDMLLSKFTSLNNRYKIIYASIESCAGNIGQKDKVLISRQALTHSDPTRLAWFLSVCRASDAMILGEIDDALWIMPPDHPELKFYNARKNHLIQNLKLCDLVVCSNHDLSDELGKLDVDSLVVSNKFITERLKGLTVDGSNHGHAKVNLSNDLPSSELGAENQQNSVKNKPNLLLTTSPQNEMRLFDFCNEIVESFARAPSFTVVVIGATISTQRFLRDYSWINFVDMPHIASVDTYYEYLKAITAEHKFVAGIQLEHESRFGNCKSCIKSYEYLGLGLPTLSFYQNQEAAVNSECLYSFHLVSSVADIEDLAAQSTKKKHLLIDQKRVFTDSHREMESLALKLSSFDGEVESQALNG
jgi:GT2 family glycosyltransferase